ncbi:MAG: hydrogenase expression/formation protein HypE [Armatimonadota bacterium]
MARKSNNDVVTLGHGSGGAMMTRLITEELLPAIGGQSPKALEDAAEIAVGERTVMSTDSFTVRPLEFPGGNIGSLAVHGTVNDLAMRGATPQYLSLGFIIEEGLSFELLRRIVRSIGEAAAEADVRVVTGDTKVVERGSADGIFINTTGIGHVTGHSPSVTTARPGDVIIVNGTLGDHGVAVMIARDDLRIAAPVQSDTASLHTLVAAMLAAAGEGVHVLRDLTRGGMAAGLNEIAHSSAVGMTLRETAIPVAAQVVGACEILGLSPYVVANEGKLAAVVAPEAAGRVLAAMKDHPLGQDAAKIGEITGERPGTVQIETPIGTHRILDLPAGELLPRIC